MRVAVTGVDGFLGREVVRQLEQSAVDVLAISRRECDLANPAAVSRLVETTRPDVVVNLAAVITFEAGSLARLYPVNTLCPGILAAECARVNAHLVHASSIAVHAAGIPLMTASTPTDPGTDYGRSKQLAERLIQASGARAAILRFGGIYGAGGPAHLGLNRSIDKARAGEAPVLAGSGAALRNYVSVQAAARDVVRCVHEHLDGVLCSGGEVLSIRAMLEALVQRWVPQLSLELKDGTDGIDQVLERSAALGPPETFVESLAAF